MVDQIYGIEPESSGYVNKFDRVQAAHSSFVAGDKLLVGSELLRDPLLAEARMAASFYSCLISCR